MSTARVDEKWKKRGHYRQSGPTRKHGWLARWMKLMDQEQSSHEARAKRRADDGDRS